MPVFEALNKLFLNSHQTSSTENIRSVSYIRIWEIFFFNSKRIWQQRFYRFMKPKFLTKMSGFAVPQKSLPRNFNNCFFPRICLLQILIRKCNPFDQIDQKTGEISQIQNSTCHIRSRFVGFGWDSLFWREIIFLFHKMTLKASTWITTHTWCQTASVELSCMKIGSRVWAPNFAKNL